MHIFSSSYKTVDWYKIIGAEMKHVCRGNSSVVGQCREREHEATQRDKIIDTVISFHNHYWMLEDTLRLFPFTPSHLAPSFSFSYSSPLSDPNSFSLSSILNPSSFLPLAFSSFPPLLYILLLLPLLHRSFSGFFSKPCLYIFSSLRLLIPALQ